MKIPQTLFVLLIGSLQVLPAQTAASVSFPAHRGTIAKAEEPRQKDTDDYNPQTGASIGVSPTLGYVFDSQDGVIRRVEGIPGSSGIGAPVTLDARLSIAWVAPQQDYIIGLSASDKRVIMTVMSRGMLVSSGYLELLPGAPDAFVFSPTGNSAAAYYAQTRTVVALKGMPNSPEIAASWDLSQFAGTVSTFAVQDTGLALAGLTQNESGGVLLALTPGSQPAVVMSLGQPSAAQFVWGRDDAVVADKSAGDIYLISQVAGIAASQVIVRASDGLAAPDLLAVDRAGSTVVAAQSGSSSGVIAGIQNGAVIPFNCTCTIAALAPLNAFSNYRLTNFGNGGFVELDARTQDVGFMFVGTGQTRSLHSVAERQK